MKKSSCRVHSSCFWTKNGLPLAVMGVIALASLPGATLEAADEARATAIAAAMMAKAQPPANRFFEATADEMNRAMHTDSAGAQKEPLQFPKGNGVRLLMSGHSFVAPATRTLPALAAAAGFAGHRQRFHTSGGSTGSANAIWLTEFGRFKDKPATPILLPAIATGQWDVLSWGAYYQDTPECYTQWIDICLKQNPNMTFLIQDGWPQYPREVSAEDKGLLLAVVEAELALGRKDLFAPLYEKLNARYPGKVHIIPAADAVVEMVKHYFAGHLPDLDCLSEHLGGKRGIYHDGGHLSSASGLDQIVGYVYFAMLYRQSPERITAYQPKGVDPTTDRLMRQAAWNAVTHSPFSGITDKTGKGVAD